MWDTNGREIILNEEMDGSWRIGMNLMLEKRMRVNISAQISEWEIWREIIFFQGLDERVERMDL